MNGRSDAGIRIGVPKGRDAGRGQRHGRFLSRKIQPFRRALDNVQERHARTVGAKNKPWGTETNIGVFVRSVSLVN